MASFDDDEIPPTIGRRELAKKYGISLRNNRAEGEISREERVRLQQAILKSIYAREGHDGVDTLLDELAAAASDAAELRERRALIKVKIAELQDAHSGERRNVSRENFEAVSAGKKPNGAAPASPEAQIHHLTEELKTIQSSLSELVPNRAFIGPQGLGKSTESRLIAELCVAYGLVDQMIYCEDTSSQIKGMTKARMKAMAEAATDNGKKLGIIVFEEFGSSVDSGYGRDAMSAILQLFDPNDHKNGATNMVKAFVNCYKREYHDLASRNSGFRSRFAEAVVFEPPPTVKPLLNVFEKQIAKQGFTLSREAKTAAEQELLKGYTKAYEMFEADHPERFDFAYYRDAETMAKKTMQACKVRGSKTIAPEDVPELRIITNMANANYSTVELKARPRGMATANDNDAGAKRNVADLMGNAPSNRTRGRPRSEGRVMDSGRGIG